EPFRREWMAPSEFTGTLHTKCQTDWHSGTPGLFTNWHEREKSRVLFRRRVLRAFENQTVLIYSGYKVAQRFYIQQNSGSKELGPILMSRDEGDLALGNVLSMKKPSQTSHFWKFLIM